MSYMALYRKFRPTEFGDVKGQEHIVTTLKNQIKAERIGHAYLFCGTRGTGKTTIAKIFAKAVNCQQPADGNPCGECAACRSIAAGASMNVIEIDAASNNGVDNIREIRDEVAYSPTEGRYKVYIIDEVHMLSIGAFNALLKTLEEPPSYVIFILATTEAHKIPVTILSRCQRYDFRRISAETITARLDELTKAEGVTAEEKALRYIAKAADGSMRDALSLLDQCIAFYLDQDLTYDHVLDVLGAVDTVVYSGLLRQTLKQDLVGVMEQIEQLVLQGRELGQFVTDFTWYLRNLLLLKSADRMEDVLDVSTENLAQLREEAQMVETDTLIRYIRIFSELGGQIRYASQKRVLVEIAFIKLCKPAMEPDTDGLLDRIRALEKQMEEGVFAAPAKEAAYESAPAKKKQAAAPVAPKALPEDVQEVVKNWFNVMNQLHPLLRTYLKDAKLKALGGSRLGIIAASSTKEEFLKEPAHLEEIRAVLQRGTGKEMDLEVASLENDPHSEIGEIDMNQIIHMEIEIEDIEE
ncbi:MAG: DNA polymerase III subunit gamma/tau [Lachnospiraceae bacterium]|jgi:DNA polymerase-3 subunit gamma/tau|nr:DNA polymerase III subunit gamma/tau [Lachnospiraceae bacterium]